MSTNEQPFELPSSGQVLNVLALAIRGWALTLEVFLHHSFGSRYIGPEGAVALGVMFLYTLCWPPQMMDMFLLYTLSFLGLCMFHRFVMVATTLHGERQHSRYSGKPWLYLSNQWISELTFKRWLEPLLALAFGMYLAKSNPPLGVYLALGSGCLFIPANESTIWERQRLRELNDAMIEQRYLAQRFRDLNGDS